jgi:hypothetical protein
MGSLIYLFRARKITAVTHCGCIDRHLIASRVLPQSLSELDSTTINTLFIGFFVCLTATHDDDSHPLSPTTFSLSLRDERPGIAKILKQKRCGNSLLLRAWLGVNNYTDEKKPWIPKLESRVKRTVSGGCMIRTLVKHYL